MKNKDKQAVGWNKDVVYASKQEFLDTHKESGISEADLNEAWDKHFAKQEKPEAKAK